MESKKFYEKILKASPYSIVSLEERIEGIDVNPLDLFQKASNYGRKKHSILYESAEVIPECGEFSIGVIDPCLKVSGKGEAFSIEALNRRGIPFLNAIKKDLFFCENLSFSEREITGILRPDKKIVSESERLKLRTHIDIIRIIAFKFKALNNEPNCDPYGGLFGNFSYDFIDQFENLPPNSDDFLQEPDYEAYYGDTLFRYNHPINNQKPSLSIVANALVIEKNQEEIYQDCCNRIEELKSSLSINLPLPQTFSPRKGSLKTDLSKEEYCTLVKKLKEHILKGDIFQAVLSRSIIFDYNAEPLDAYRELRKSNPSPYMYFINNGSSVLLGSSPEKCISVQNIDQRGTKKVEIHPIAGTKPRGFSGNHIDYDLDNRYEVELKLDPKELAEHTMLIDLARNDIARISKPGTRHVDESYAVVRYSHVRHLVSKVSGILCDEYDALHAYLASMNMGTLTGAPKVEAMKLLRKYEKNKRGFYGGAVFYLTPEGNFDSAITIRSMRIKDGKAYLRAGAGIVHDSIPESEFEETEKKLAACLKAIRHTRGSIL